MGTRSLTKVKDFDGKDLVCIYRQYDGYQEGQGFDLKNKLANKNLVNGFSSKNQTDCFNGMGCLAASLVANLKTHIGLFYLVPPDYEDDYIDFNYTIYPDCEDRESAEIMIKVESGKSVLYEGKIDDYSAKDECSED